jgi:hypothetical protein
LSILWRSISIQNSMVPRWLIQVLHPPQKFERPLFWNAWRYRIKMYGVEVTFNDMTSILNFIKIYQLVKKLLGGQSDRHIDSWSHKPHFPFYASIKEINCRFIYDLLLYQFATAYVQPLTVVFREVAILLLYFLYFIYLWRKLNSLQRCDIAQNYRILHRVVQRLSQHNLKISHHRHI